MLTSSFDRSTFYSELRATEVRLAEQIRDCRTRRRASSCLSSNHGNWYLGALRGYGVRVRCVRDALDESEHIALRILRCKFDRISIDTIWPILRTVCHDIALYLGGGAIAGAVVGGGLGFLVFSGGVVHGAAASSVICTRMTAVLVSFLGLRSAVQYMLQNIPRAVDEYRRGCAEAWGPLPDLRSHGGPHYGAEMNINGYGHAGKTFARGHEIIVLSMLTGIAAYITSSRGNVGTLLVEARQSARLGPNFANWLEQNAENLGKHPLLQTANRPSGAISAGTSVPLGRATKVPSLKTEHSVVNRAAKDPAPLTRSSRESFGTAIQTYWPPNGGFAGTPVPETLKPGYRFSRYGGFVDDTGSFTDFGSFTAPANVPYGMRALPPGTDRTPLSIYEVVQPIVDVPSGPAAPYFGELGLGKQHQLPLPIQDYLDQGIIRLVERKIP